MPKKLGLVRKKYATFSARKIWEVDRSVAEYKDIFVTAYSCRFQRVSYFLGIGGHAGRIECHVVRVTRSHCDKYSRYK